LTEKRRPALCVHPGEHLVEELDARGWTTVELAERMGNWPIDQVRGVLAGERDITQLFAWRLADALGTSASMWLKLQQGWLEWRRVDG
jgi:HTH-type transcriptional regulator/antitoxin HigA